MKHRETSFSLIFVAVILAHLGVIGWLFVGPRGCQQDLTASQTLTPEDKPPIQLNLSLSDRVTPETDATEPEPPLPPRQTQVTEDPESRLVLPKAPVVEVPTPEPVVDDSAEKAREAAKQKALLAEQQRRAEEAEAKLAQLEKEKQRAIEAEAAKNKRAVADAEQAKRKAAEKKRLETEAKAKREKDRQENLLAQQRKAKAAAAALKRKQVEEELECETIRQREAEKLAKAARERQRVAAAKQQELARQREAQQRKAEEARKLAERLERERAEAARIERAKVVSQPAVVKAKTVGAGGGTGQQAIVPAKPAGGNGRPAPVKVDMAGYRVSVEKMIRNRWTVPKGIAVDRRPEVILRINRAGKVVYSRLSQKSGNPNLDRSAINAVQIGSRLIPLPPGYDKGLYEVKVKFEID